MAKSREQILDELLVLRSQQGDGDSFNELVTRWQPRLWQHARLLTGNDEAAWDVVQESWMAIVRHIRRLKDAELFPQWALRIVGNKSADWLRRQTRDRRAANVISHNSDHSGPERDPTAVFDRADALRAAFALLPADRREILSLAYVQGLGIAGIAAVLRIPEGTVKSRLFHARSELQRLLERQK